MNQETARAPFDPGRLDALLRDSLGDVSLDNDEKAELRALGANASAEQLRALRNRAFELARTLLREDAGAALDVLRWLEQVVRTLDLLRPPEPVAGRVLFSPGDACRRELIGLCRRARRTLDVCVFTIADDRLTAELLAAHARGVAVRIVTDDAKRFDDGSDILQLARAGIAVRCDASPYHMHHKFALFDGATLANGSFNWTRTASSENDENLVVSRDAYLVRSFGAQFEKLWARFSPLR